MHLSWAAVACLQGAWRRQAFPGGTRRCRPPGPGWWDPRPCCGAGSPGAWFRSCQVSTVMQGACHRQMPGCWWRHLFWDLTCGAQPPPGGPVRGALCSQFFCQSRDCFGVTRNRRNLSQYPLPSKQNKKKRLNIHMQQTNKQTSNRSWCSLGPGGRT